MKYKYKVIKLIKYCQKWFNHQKNKITLVWLKEKIFLLLPNVSIEKNKLLHQELSVDASWNKNYIVCTVCACLIATFGLITNSTAVIIGAMLVAPLMLPLRGLAFAACEGNFKLFRTALLSIIGATILAIFLSYLIGKIVNIPETGSEILSRTQPNLIDLGIAITAGGMSGFAKVRVGISDTLAGTAIAVALMPPLCVVGLTLSQNLPSFALGAFLLYITNLLGICLACMFIFIFSGYTKINVALGWVSFLTTLLLIPLGASFVRLIQQQKVEAEIIRKLTQETITVGQNVENTRIEIIWTQTPPLVYVFLETEKEITPKQVELVQNYLSQKMLRTFELVFYVIPVKQITSKDKESVKLRDTNFSFPDISPFLPSDNLKTPPSNDQSPSPEKEFNNLSPHKSDRNHNY